MRTLGKVVALVAIVGCGKNQPPNLPVAPPAPAVPAATPGPGVKGKQPLTEEQKAWRNITKANPDAP